MSDIDQKLLILRKRHQELLRLIISVTIEDLKEQYCEECREVEQEIAIRMAEKQSTAEKKAADEKVKLIEEQKRRQLSAYTWQTFDAWLDDELTADQKNIMCKQRVRYPKNLADRRTILIMGQVLSHSYEIYNVNGELLDQIGHISVRNTSIPLFVNYVGSVAAYDACDKTTLLVGRRKSEDADQWNCDDQFNDDQFNDDQWNCDV